MNPSARNVTVLPLVDGTSARMQRVLHGTNNSQWGGTRAYQVGVDFVVEVHCRYCCCREDGCSASIVPAVRVFYHVGDEKEWVRMAYDVAADHVERSSFHG